MVSCVVTESIRRGRGTTDREREMERGKERENRVSSEITLIPLKPCSGG